jgi:hypothetical protein
VPPTCVTREIAANEICVVRTQRAFKPVSFVGSFRSVPQSLAISTVLQAFQTAAGEFVREQGPDLAWTP